MGLFRRIAGMLGFSKDEDIEVDSDSQAPKRPHLQETGLPRRGFAVPVQVTVDRPQPGPVIIPSNPGDGGVQGLRWYAKSLKIDEDGDVADEFLDEVLPETLTMSNEKHHKPLTRFQVNYTTRPAKVKNQVMSKEGKIQLGVEHHGRLQWV